MMKCTNCDGTGKVHFEVGPASIKTWTETCPRCAGAGEFDEAADAARLLIPGYDPPWGPCKGIARIIRRRIEDALRKTATAADLIAAARLLGVKTE